ncbi:rRNA methyltransferase [Spirochaetia bacterium]|nr:rRNA methyltransferase [Spirochaetia bacterium]
MIISVPNAEFQIIEALKTNRVKRAKTHEVFIEGIESIKQALRANLEITRIIIRKTEPISDWARDVIKNSGGTKIIEMSAELYNQLCDRNNPSEMLVTAKINALALSDVKLSEKPFILLFDRPSDTGNLGSIIRSANSFNADALFIIGHGVDVYESKVIRASLGGIFFTQIVMLQSLDELEAFIGQEKIKNGMKVLGTDSRGDIPLTGGALNRPLMIIIGNEAKGISLAIRGLCDGIINIPISGEVNSLNAASAGSIFMWEVYKSSV